MRPRKPKGLPTNLTEVPKGWVKVELEGGVTSWRPRGRETVQEIVGGFVGPEILSQKAKMNAFKNLRKLFEREGVNVHIAGRRMEITGGKNAFVLVLPENLTPKTNLGKAFAELFMKMPEGLVYVSKYRLSNITPLQARLRNP
ncbi:MAG: hypothetical protein V1494_05675 [Candidatus Diapherotrites archaeon]